MNRIKNHLPACCLGVVLALTAPTVQAQVVINEVCAFNRGDFADNYADYEDWIELYNTGTAAVDLSGYYLSDDEDEPDKWAFPSGATLGAGEYMVVICSDRNEFSGGYYHTSFKINQTNQEGAVLADPAGNVLDAYQLTERTQLHHSRGRTPNGGATWAIFTDPTPGQPNAAPFTAYAPEPQANLEAGFYGGAITVSFADPGAGNTIYYTTDGSTPSAGSQVYAGPIAINATTVLRARCVSDDGSVLPGMILTNTYFINEVHTVPVASVSGDDVLTLLGGMQIEPIGHLELFDAAGNLLAEAGGEYNKHGNDSWAYDQRGIDYIARDEYGYGDALYTPIFRIKDRESFQRVMFKAGANDNYPFEDGGAHIRDAYVQSLSQIADLRMDERSYEPYILYINGQYWGVYEIREKVDDHDFTDYYYNQNKYNIDYIKTWGGTWEEYGSIDEWDDLRDFILTEDMTDAANYEYVDDRYNTGSLIDYFILNSYIVSADWLNWNTSWWRGRNPNGDKKKWRYTLWDMDASFDHYVNYTGVPDVSANADVCNPEQLGDPGGQGHVPIWNTLLNNEDFFSDYVNRFSELSTTHFTCERLHQHLDSLITIITPEMPRHFDRWGGNMAEWQANVQAIHDFIDERCVMLNNSLLDCYDELEGPYTVVLDVEPAGAGTLSLTSTDLEDLPFAATIFGGITAEFSAEALPGYTFSHWTTQNNTVLPSTNSAELEFMLTANDTLIAHFVPDINYAVTFQTTPTGVGQIAVNGDVLTANPQSVELAANVAHSLQASAVAPGYRFAYWTTENHPVLPQNSEEQVTLTITEADVVTAHFEEITYQATFSVVPPGADVRMLVEDTVLTTFPTTLTLPGEVDLNVSVQIEDEFLSFGGWEGYGATLATPAELSTAVQLTDDALVEAVFAVIPSQEVTLNVYPARSGTIRVGDQTITDFPYTGRFRSDIPLAVEARPNQFHLFEKWTYQANAVEPSHLQASGNVRFLVTDELTANFAERLNAVWIPNSFTPNGDGFNDLIRVEGSELSDKNFIFRIYSRWGEVVFETNDISKAWNGTHRNGNYLCPAGVYQCFIQYTNAITGNDYQFTSAITLIR